MKEFLILLREPDGRNQPHDPAFTETHQKHWNDWLSKLMAAGQLAGGQALTLNGRLLFPGGMITSSIHQAGKEIIGGYLLIKATSLDEATSLMKDCPVYEAGGYAEVREGM